MSKIGEELADGQAFSLYHPESFYLLRRWLEIIETLTITRDLEKLKVDAQNAGLQPTLTALGAFEAVETALKTRRDRASLSRHLHTWFDGFRTLKMIHHLRDQTHPPMRWESALAAAPFLDGVSGCPRASLHRLRSINS